MRPLRFALPAAVAAVLGLAASLALAGGGEPPGPERTVTRDGRVEIVREVSVAWQLADVSRDGRTLKLFYESGGCGHDNGHANVDEGRTTIEIGVRQDITTDVLNLPPGVAFACEDDLRILPLRVRLSRPVDGRRIDGGPQMASDRTRFSRSRVVGNRLVILVPNTVGLAPGDAVGLLAAQGFHARTTGRPGDQVVSQRPRAGKRPLKGKNGRKRPVVLVVR